MNFPQILGSRVQKTAVSPLPEKPPPSRALCLRSVSRSFQAPSKMNQSEEVMAARAKLAQKFDAVRTGGKGTTRRRKMVKHQANSADEKQLQAHLKRLGLNNIPGIEEVNMFMEDGGVLHFNTPKVQAAVGANTYVISGAPEEKRLEELRRRFNDGRCEVMAWGRQPDELEKNCRRQGSASRPSAAHHGFPGGATVPSP
eukprot:Skav227470  [mRNA]  locus=scaffold2491:374871:379273:+ [translate_table: standard]